MGEGKTASGLPPKISLVNSAERLLREKKDREADEGGRRAIVILFFLTVGLSLLFLAQRYLADWLNDFFGPPS